MPPKGAQGNPFTPTGKSIYPHRRISLGSKAGIAQVCDGWSHRCATRNTQVSDEKHTGE